MRVIFSEDMIEKRIKNVAGLLNKYYQNKKNVVIIFIKEGGRMFFEKLLRYLNFKYEKDSIKVKSYNGMKSDNLVWIEKPSLDLHQKACLLIDDILDTGKTIAKVKDAVINSGATECKICVAINKHENRIIDIMPDYYLFDIDKGFLVGFGMDYNEKYRDLPYISIIG